MAKTFTFDYLTDRFALRPPPGFQVVRDQETGKIVTDGGNVVIAPKGE